MHVVLILNILLIPCPMRKNLVEFYFSAALAPYSIKFFRWKKRKTVAMRIFVYPVHFQFYFYCSGISLFSVDKLTCYCCCIYILKKCQMHLYICCLFINHKRKSSIFFWYFIQKPSERKRKKRSHCWFYWNQKFHYVFIYLFVVVQTVQHASRAYNYEKKNAFYNIVFM